MSLCRYILPQNYGNFSIIKPKSQKISVFWWILLFGATIIR